MPLTTEGKERSFRENVLLAFSLSGVAGAVNAIGFIELGFLTSHVTGTATKIGTNAAAARWLDLRATVLLLAMFIAGAMAATILVEVARRHHFPRFQLPLLLEAMLLSVIGLLERTGDVDDAQKLPLALGLAFAMGLQNALVTRLSGAVVRTTHLTGLATDVGIELVRVATWFLKRTAGEGLIDRIKHVAVVKDDPELYRARLHATIMFSFIGGAALGAWLATTTGPLAIALPVLVLVGLVVYDRVLAVSDEDLDGEFNPAFARPAGDATTNAAATDAAAGTATNAGS